MTRLYVDQTVQINALARRVWEVLTLPEYTAQWAPEFSGGQAGFHIESNWSLGDTVLWKDRKGKTIVEGTVTAAIHEQLLRFTVFDVRARRPSASEDDGITYKLTEKDGRTTLWVSQGDFSTMEDGVRFRDLSDEIWSRVLTKVKKLAESPSPGD
jgi:uncharacterized protein YndB with AHSA1/START domain